MLICAVDREFHKLQGEEPIKKRGNSSLSASGDSSQRIYCVCQTYR